MTYVVTPSQRRVLGELVRDGPPNKVLARRLHVTEQTVKWHLAEVGKATGLQTRTAIALWWIREGQYAGLAEAA